MQGAAFAVRTHPHRGVKSSELNRRQHKDFLEPVISRLTATTSAEQPAYLMSPLLLRPAISHSDADAIHCSGRIPVQILNTLKCLIGIGRNLVLIAVAIALIYH